MSGRLSDLKTSQLRPDHPDVRAALALHGLELDEVTDDGYWEYMDAELKIEPRATGDEP